MIPLEIRHLYRSSRLELAPAAALERDQRRDIYPERIRAGTIEHRDAEGDLRAWYGIADWLAGERIHFDITFEEMELAAARALQTGQAAAEAAPEDRRGAFLTRRDNIAEILSLVKGHREWLEEINLALRRQAAAEAEAA